MYKKPDCVLHWFVVYELTEINLIFIHDSSHQDILIYGLLINNVSSTSQVTCNFVQDYINEPLNSRISTFYGCLAKLCSSHPNPTINIAAYLLRLGGGRAALPGSVSIGVMLNSGVLNWIFLGCPGLAPPVLLLFAPLLLPPPLLMIPVIPFPLGSLFVVVVVDIAALLLFTLFIEINSNSLLDNFFCKAIIVGFLD